MDNRVRNIVQEAIREMIINTSSINNIKRSFLVHQSKLHFVPIQYRVLGGLIQSLNIKFGNFIEKLIGLIVENDSKVQTHIDSGKKINLTISAETERAIDSYMTRRQLPNSKDDCTDDFMELIDFINIHERESRDGDIVTIRRDIDALFYSSSGELIYLEIKYNDDHDTSKFENINRKFLKTYAGLVERYGKNNTKIILPIIYYFNPTKRYGPIYVPSSYIFRGEYLFENYFEIKYSEIDAYLRDLGNDPEVIAIFDQLYQMIRNHE